MPTDGLLVITGDAKGVVMHREDLRPATRTASERTPRSKLNTRLSKGEKRNRKRMAMVAAVYAVAAQVRTPEQMLAVLARDEEAEPRPARPRPQHKRVWASLEQEPREVLEEAFREALQRDPQGNQRWVAVVDGNETPADHPQGTGQALRSATDDRARHLSRAGIPVEGGSRVGG